jgi:hypothetical protein
MKKIIILVAILCLASSFKYDEDMLDSLVGIYDVGAQCSSMSCSTSLYNDAKKSFTCPSSGLETAYITSDYEFHFYAYNALWIDEEVVVKLQLDNDY